MAITFPFSIHKQKRLFPPPPNHHSQGFNGKHRHYIATIKATYILVSNPHSGFSHRRISAAKQSFDKEKEPARAAFFSPGRMPRWALRWFGAGFREGSDSFQRVVGLLKKCYLSIHWARGERAIFL